MGEDQSGDVFVVHLESWSVVEDALNNNSTSSDSNRSQRDLVSHVSNCIDAWNRGVLEFVDDDGTTANFDSSVLQKERGDVGRSAESNQALVGLD